MLTFKNARCAIAAVATLLMIGGSQAMPVPAITVPTTGGGASSTYDGWTLGYRFDALAATNVVSLGIWDYESNGLAEAHAVGLWDSAGSLLASVTVAAGTSDLLDGGYRWVDLPTSVPLHLGQTYTVAAYYDTTNDDLVADLISVASVAVDSRVHVQGSVQLAGGGLSFATQTAHPFPGSGFSYGGGNVRLNNAVPEPAGIALVAVGLLGAAFARKRRVR